MIDIVLIAVSLALDAFAVSVSTGISTPGFGLKQGLKVGLWFGSFQLIMPLLGWFLGRSAASFIVSFDHWLAFALLAFIGGRMIWDSFGEKEAFSPPVDLSPQQLCVLAIATSIDAMAVGISMAFMNVHIVFASAIIGGVAFALSLVGGLLGRFLGHLFQKWAQVAGGMVLIGIGFKILLEHLAK